jgi:hypothetical protein
MKHHSRGQNVKDVCGSGLFWQLPFDLHNVKLSLCLSTTHWRRGGKIPHIRDFNTKWRRVKDVTLSPLAPGGRMDRGVVWTWWWPDKFLSQPEVEPQSPSPWAFCLVIELLIWYYLMNFITFITKHRGLSSSPLRVSVRKPTILTEDLDDLRGSLQLL